MPNALRWAGSSPDISSFFCEISGSNKRAIE